MSSATLGAGVPKSQEDSERALFGLAAEGFAWATGIEDTFIGQTERVGERVLDEYALTHHYLYWREDIDRAAALGVHAMRYGVPWYKVEPLAGKYDWDWMDRVLEYAAGKGIAVIADLMHYGTPLWLENQFLNASYPQRVADYASTFARRYSHLLSHYTPLNEPLITLDFCGGRGIWPPYLRGDDGWVKLLRQVARGIVLTVEALRAADPQARIVHVEAASDHLPASPELAQEAAFWNMRGLLATDLVTGKVRQGHPGVEYVFANGMTDADLAFHAERPIGIDVMGVNYYPETSIEELRQVEGGVERRKVWGGTEGLARVMRKFAQRYGRPLFLSECSTNGTLDLRARWLRDSIAAIPQLRRSGLPLVGYTWWPLFDLIDWSYRSGARPVEEFVARLGPPVLSVDQVANMIRGMRWNALEQLPLEAYLAPMGLYALEMQFDGTFARVPTPLVEQYRDFIAQGADFVGVIADGISAS